MQKAAPPSPPLNEPAYVRYVFLYIVKFTSGRSVEAQCDVINRLSVMLRDTLADVGLSDTQRTLIPTGDGVAIALFNVDYDTHLTVALNLLARVDATNHLESDKMRQFQVRVGLNENVDNVIEDVNRQRNVAGAGISMAQRIMDKADGGQLLVGEGVYNALSPRERYMSHFRRFETTTKHNTPLTVYQFVDKARPGLNTDLPQAFTSRQTERPKLSKFVAYYLAISAVNKKFLFDLPPDGVRDYVAIILISFLAEDKEEESETPVHDRTEGMTWRAGKATFAEQFAYYKTIEFWVLCRLARCIEKNFLQRYDDCFEAGSLDTSYAFVSEPGLDRLRKEWPQVAEAFGLRKSA